MALIDYTWLVPALSAVAFVIIAWLGLRTPEKGGWIAVSLVGAAGALCVALFWQVVSGAVPATFENPIVQSFEWWKVGEYALNLGTYVDPLTAFMLFVVGVLVTLICIYSIGYMHEEGSGRRRYYMELTLFITGMLGLVVASNYLMLFIFWEIMGLCSYLLIGFWYTKDSAAKAAKKAFLTTRVGDIFLLLGLVILLVTFGTLDFDALFAMKAAGSDLYWLGIANLFIFIGAVGKSAQFPLHVWLPDAMEGPTTVSALIHAATMVKAGVYLIARSYPLMVQTPWVLVVIAVIGGFTALFAATMALVNYDLKRVLAYSTLSQLGYMFLALGVAGALMGTTGAIPAVALAGFTVAVFHLFSHAFFKAGLFLSAGSVGHAVHTYDMRLMGGLRKHMPITTFAMLMGTISIAGIPPFSGFFSKDAILETVFEAAYHDGHVNYLYMGLWIAALLTAFLTAYYMFRLYFMTFEGRYRGQDVVQHTGHGPASPAHAAVPDVEHHHVHLHESPRSMTIPLAILGFFAIFGGIIMFALFHGGVGLFLPAPAQAVANSGFAADTHAAHGLVAAIAEPFKHALTYVTLVAALAGIGLAYFWWGPANVERNIKQDHEITGFAKVLSRRYYIDDAYNWAIMTFVVGFAKIEKWFDENVIDGIVNGIATANQQWGNALRRWNTGNVQDYALSLMAGFVLIVLGVIYVTLIKQGTLTSFFGLVTGGL